MKTFRKLSFATLSALVSFAVSAAALEVGSGETVDISDSRTYDSVSINGGTIVLKAGGVLRAGGVNVGSADSTITFNGGRLAISEPLKATGAGNLYLDGTGGDVIIDNVSVAWRRISDYESGATGRVYVRGDHNFVVNVSRNGGITKKENGIDSFLFLQHTGRTEINNATGDGVFAQGNGWGNLFENQETRWGWGTMLDMANVYHGMKKSLVGAGSVSGSYIRFEIPHDSVATCSVQVASVRDIVKREAGRLDVFGAAPTNLTIEAGEICVLPRSQFGYSEFRLKIDGVGTAQKSAMGFNAIALYSGETDISSEFASARLGSYGHDGGYAANLLDGESDSGWWYGYDVNGGSTENPSFDNAYLDIRFNDRRIVTGYKFRTRLTNSDFPTSWRLFGRDPGGEWELLDQCVDAKLPGKELTWSDMFTATIPADADSTTRCKTLSMNSGAKLTVLSNATFVCDSFIPKGSEVLDFKSGSSVDFASHDASGAATNIDFRIDAASSLAGAFAKSGEGTMTFTGLSAAAAPEKIHAKEGTLSFHSHNSWKHWKFAFGDLDNNKGTPSGLALDEIAVFDADGNRLNVTGTVTMAGLTETSFSDWRKAMAYDGINDTLGYISAVPNPADESTWVYTSFSLSQSAPAVASYNLMSGGNGPSSSRPKTWKVYARENATDEWTLIDSKTNVATPSSNSTWYNGGTPWPVVAAEGYGTAAFGASVPITVDPGATLDLTRASETVISELIVDGDASGVGTIRGGTCAAEGVVRVTYEGEAPVPPFTLPIVFDSVAQTKYLSGWTLEINGKPSRKKLAVGAGGQLCVRNASLTVIIR